MIDTLKNIPSVKNITNLIIYLSTQYVEWGKFDIGPWPLTYAYNDIEEKPSLTSGGEGSRFRLGFRTNENLSNKLELNGYLAYGTMDEEFKYQGGVGYVLDRKPWTRLDIKYGKDIQQVGLNTNEKFVGRTAIETFVRNRDLVSPYWETRSSIAVERQLFKGFNQKVEFKHRFIDPIFNYAYNLDSDPGILYSDFNTTEVTLTSRLGRDELWVINDNERISLGAVNDPIYTLSYTLGLEDIVGGDFNFHKVVFQIEQDLKNGICGYFILYLDWR